METAVLTTPEPVYRNETTLEPGTDRAKQISQLGVQARLAKQAQAKEAKLKPVTTDAERYKQQRLMRVRKQLDVLQDCFDQALAGTLYTLDKKLGPVQVFDPAHIDRIAAAIARVAELERQLSDWALPGSKRPRPESAKRSPSICLPSDENE